MFIPYRARIKITRKPVMTIVITVVCLLVYWAQVKSWDRVNQSAERFCTDQVAVDLVRGQHLAFPLSTYACADILFHIYVLGGGAQKHLDWHLERIRVKGDTEAAELLIRHYGNFAAQAPSDLTSKLTHQSGSWNPLRLLSATISHGSWDHIIGNLFFFAAFATVVETVIGPVLFLLVFLGMGLGTGMLENLLTATREGVESLGLSGVVMGFLTLAAYLAPKVKIKFFYFYFLFFGVLSWPLWSVAAWYVFWNLWDYHFWRDFSSISYVGHLAGAATGLILGLILFREKRHWASEQIVLDEPVLTEDESWFSKFNAMAATPVIAYLVLFYGIAAVVLGIYLFVTFIKTFTAQLLIAAPIVAGLIQIYRLKQPKKPDWVQLQQGIQCLNNHEFQNAERILRPLAEKGYPRGQLVLAQLLSSASLAIRNEPEAIKWYEAAAQRGLPEAQYAIGIRCLHGQGMVKDLPRAIEWLEKAASKGSPEAASSLGHIYENGPKGTADRDKAIEWYYRAGVAFYKTGRLEDAKAMIKELNNVADRYPAVFQLITELDSLVSGKSSMDKK